MVSSPLVRESGIRNPESTIFWPLESGIQGFGIRNPDSGIRNPTRGIRNSTRGIRNPTSSITLESRSEMYCTVSSNFIRNHHLPLPLGVPYPDHHRQKVFGHLTCTSNMSTLWLGVFYSLLGPCFICLRSFF